MAVEYDRTFPTDDYIHYEYIESNGTSQYIDTGITKKLLSDEGGNSKTSKKYKFSVIMDASFLNSTLPSKHLWSLALTASTSTKSFTGIETASSNNNLLTGESWGSINLPRTIKDAVNTSNNFVYTTERCLYENVKYGFTRLNSTYQPADEGISVYNNPDGALGDKIGWVKEDTGTGSALGSNTTQPFVLFAVRDIWDSNTFKNFCAVRCYGFKILSWARTKIVDGVEVIDTDTDALPLEEPRTLIDLVPAQRRSDNKVGMYDFVSKTFFTSGDGTNFNHGEEISYRDYTINASILTHDTTGYISGAGQLKENTNCTLRWHDTASRWRVVQWKKKDPENPSEYITLSSSNPYVFKVTQDENIYLDLEPYGSCILL